MNAPASASERRSPENQYLIPAISSLLIGLYFGQFLPPGTDLVFLQTGMIGMIAFLGLRYQSELQPQRPVEPAEEPRPALPSRRVERRLDRHVAEPRTHGASVTGAKHRNGQADPVDSAVQAAQIDVESVSC